MRTNYTMTCVWRVWPGRMYIGVLGVKRAKNAIVTDKNAPHQHFKVVGGICGIKGSISFESNARPGHFLYIKQGHRWVYLGEYDDKADYLNSACFYPRYNKYFDVGSLKSFYTLAHCKIKKSAWKKFTACF